MRTILIEEDTYKKLVEIKGEIMKREKRQVSFDYVIKRLVEFVKR